MMALNVGPEVPDQHAGQPGQGRVIESGSSLRKVVDEQRADLRIAYPVRVDELWDRAPSLQLQCTVVGWLS